MVTLVQRLCGESPSGQATTLGSSVITSSSQASARHHAHASHWFQTNLDVTGAIYKDQSQVRVTALYAVSTSPNLLIAIVNFSCYFCEKQWLFPRWKVCQTRLLMLFVSLCFFFKSTRNVSLEYLTASRVFLILLNNKTPKTVQSHSRSEQATFVERIVQDKVTAASRCRTSSFHMTIIWFITTEQLLSFAPCVCPWKTASHHDDFASHYGIVFARFSTHNPRRILKLCRVPLTLQWVSTQRSRKANIRFGST
jgi:uncharacterized membrane protein YwzB